MVRFRVIPVSVARQQFTTWEYSCCRRRADSGRGSDGEHRFGAKRKRQKILPGVSGVGKEKEKHADAYHAANRRGGDFRCVEQRLRRQMRVPLGHADLRMAKQPLHHVERYALIDQKAGRAFRGNCPI
jgi:hypothetical protein